MKKGKNLLLLGATVLMMTFTAHTATAGGGIKLVQLGVRGGLQTQSVKMSTNDLVQGFADRDFGYQLGFMGRISLPGFFLQPELMYSSHKFRLNIDDAGATKVRVQTVEVPVLVGFKVLFLSLYAGPTFNLLTDTSNKADKTTMAFNSDFYKSVVGYQLGAGVEFGRLVFDIRYGGQFKKSIQTVTIGSHAPVDVKTRMNQWLFNVGYFF